MKILFVATDYPGKGKPTTGFPNYLYRVSLALVQMGHEPMILAAGEKDSHRVEQGINIWTVKVRYIKCGFQTLEFVINSLNKSYILNKKINKMIAEMSIDVIQFTSLAGTAMLYRGRIPAVLRLSSYARTSFASLQTFSAKTVYVMSVLERLSAHNCKAVFAPCRNTAEAFGKDSKRKVKVIETPFINDVKEEDYKYVNRYLSGKKYVLFFGTLYPDKGVFIIAEILREFLEKNPEYSFVFVGESMITNGEDPRETIRDSAGTFVKRIIILDAMPHKQLYPIIKNADFVVLPSLMDNFPNACIEAMYFAKVVIGTNGASFEQLITHEKSGLLCKIGDSKDLLEKMQMAVSMSDIQKKQMGENARLRIDKLRPEKVVQQLLQFYQYVIDRNV